MTQKADRFTNWMVEEFRKEYRERTGRILYILPSGKLGSRKAPKRK